MSLKHVKIRFLYFKIASNNRFKNVFKIILTYFKIIWNIYLFCFQNMLKIIEPTIKYVFLYLKKKFTRFKNIGEKHYFVSKQYIKNISNIFLKYIKIVCTIF